MFGSESNYRYSRLIRSKSYAFTEEQTGLTLHAAPYWLDRRGETLCTTIALARA
jgi:hypothetical protein